jgi:hypothetical protein
MFKMNKLCLVAWLGLLVFAGCEAIDQEREELAVDVSEVNDRNFPSELVGVWLSEVDGSTQWGFRFEPDGTVSKIQHYLTGNTDFTLEPIYLEGPDPNFYATFVFEPIEIDYNAETRELSVAVIIEKYFMKIPQGELEGRSEDYFTGAVSEDFKVWETEWLNYGWLEGAADPDPNKIPPQKLTFKKAL